MTEGGTITNVDVITGTIEIYGESVRYSYRRRFHMPKTNVWHNTIEADYHGKHIVIGDHGGGLQYALGLLRHLIVSIQHGHTA